MHFDGETLEALVKELEELPALDCSVKRRRVGYTLLTHRLMPVVVTLYKRGYTRTLVRERIAQRLGVSKRNRTVMKLVNDAFEVYRQEVFDCDKLRENIESGE